ncbi:hypothetical protein GYMLUDRAFT_258871 [Collybiopsis luxurians FD-317 M1]|nr:hypothetical protein GYMLUDRAFT_258871 [Collybiopsis luxurians FD-317 M1]
MVQPDGAEYKSMRVFVSRRGISRHLLSKFSISREGTPAPAFIKIKPEDKGPPTFTNPWDGTTIDSGITSDGNVVYSTEVYWGTHVQRGEPQKLTNIERKYFGSDDDEIHLPPKFQGRFIYNYY